MRTPKEFSDGYERMMLLIRLFGWNRARDIMNEERPVGYHPHNHHDYHTGEGMMAALSETM